MRNNLFTPVFIFFAIISTISCNTPRYMYSPGASNVPMFEEKGDSKLALNYSTNFGGQRTEEGIQYPKRSRGTDIMAAYAITDKLAIQSSFFSRVERNGGSTAGVFDSSIVHYKRNIFDVGVGYYTSMSPANDFWFQIFVGMGKGKFKFEDAGLTAGSLPYARFHSADLTKYYIQPAFNFQEDNVGISLASRINFIRFRNIETNYTKEEESRLNLKDIHNRTLVFWEPTLVNNFGIKSFPGLRFEYQLGVSFHLSNDVTYTRKFNFSLGLLADIPKLLKGNK